MKEYTFDNEEREIIRMEESQMRIRLENSDRIEQNKNLRSLSPNFDKTSFKWLEQNYLRIHGLRDWTWIKIINGIIKQHQKEIENKGEASEIDEKFISLIWMTIFELSGINDFKKVP